MTVPILLARYIIRWHVWRPLRRRVITPLYDAVYHVRYLCMSPVQRVAEMRHWNARLVSDGVLTVEQAWVVEEAMSEMEKGGKS